MCLCLILGDYYKDKGKENGSYYNIFGLYREYGFGYITVRSPYRGIIPG